MDMKVIRRAEAGSDHYLVQMKVDVKLRKLKKLRVRRLEEREVRWKFQSELGAKFRQRRNKEEDGIEEVWQCFKEM